MTAVDSTSEEHLRVERATAGDEAPVYIRAGEEHVFGIVTRPTGPANGTAVLCLHAGAQTLTSHRNGVYTRLCRDLAAAGYTTLRIDYHGTGDSSGVLVDRSPLGQTIVDVEAAVQWLTEQGTPRVVVVGTCWGALVGLLAAARQKSVVAASLISPPLQLIETGASATHRRQRHEPLIRALSHALRPTTLRLLLAERQYRTWLVTRAWRRVARSLPARTSRGRRVDQGADHVTLSAQSLFKPLARRGVEVRVLLGENEPTYVALKEKGALPALEAASQIIDVQVTPVALHGLTTVRAQDEAVRFVKDSLVRHAGPPMPLSSRGTGAGLLVDD